MMTAFAFILRVVPLVISIGAGAEMRRTLGTAVFCGMLGVTIFGIFLTPAFYYVIQWLVGPHRASFSEVNLQNGFAAVFMRAGFAGRRRVGWALPTKRSERLNHQ